MSQKLTATEDVRFEKFNTAIRMDKDTKAAMRNLFEYTKPGCDHLSYELMHAAHNRSHALSDGAIASFKPLGLTLPNGVVPAKIARAIRSAVAHGYLVMHDFTPPQLKPDPRTLTLQ